MEKPQFRLSQISNVMLGVRDLARAVAFYHDTLGLRVKFESPGFAFLDGGSVTLCLSQPLARANEKIPGATEVVFAVEDVRAAYQALLERGVRFTHEPRNVAGSSWAANFADPDGHGLSIFGPERKA
jgi:catechol 2,3-dioxygenase-like lactoylglutathione lyase family enzyme